MRLPIVFFMIHGCHSLQICLSPSDIKTYRVSRSSMQGMWHSNLYVSIHVVSKIQISPKNKPRLTHLQMKQLKITPRKTWSVFNPQSQVLHNVVLHSLTSVSIHFKVFQRDKMSHDLSKHDFRKIDLQSVIPHGRRPGELCQALTCPGANPLWVCCQ